MSRKLKISHFALVTAATLGVALTSAGSASAAVPHILVIGCGPATSPTIEGSHDAASPGQAPMQQRQAGAAAPVPADTWRPAILSSPCGHRR